MSPCRGAETTSSSVLSATFEAFGCPSVVSRRQRVGVLGRQSVTREECTCRNTPCRANCSEEILRVIVWTHFLHSEFKFVYSSQGCIVGPFHENAVWVCDCTVVRDVLSSPEGAFLRDDCLTLECELDVVFNSVDTSGQSSTHLFGIPTYISALFGSSKKLKTT